MKNNETWSTKELVNYMSQSIEALRLENARLMDENERLTMGIEVHDAEIVSNDYGQRFYNFQNSSNTYSQKTN